MDYGFANSNSALNNSENCVIQNKDDSTGHLTHALVQTEINTSSCKSESTLHLYKQPESFIKRAFVRIPSINSLDFKHLQNSLFFQLLFEQYSHLLKLKLEMTKSNYPYQMINGSERNDNIANTCTKTVRDGMYERKALKFFRLHQTQKKTICCSKSASNVNENLSGDETDIGNKAKTLTKNKSIQMSKTMKNLAKSANIVSPMTTSNETIVKCGNQNTHGLNENLLEKDCCKKYKVKSCLTNLERPTIKQYVSSKNCEGKETIEEIGKNQKSRKLNGFLMRDGNKSTNEEQEKLHSKTLGRTKKQERNNKNKPGSDTAEINSKISRKARVRQAWMENMSGDTSTDSNATKPDVLKISHYKLEKTKNSRDIPHEAALKKRKQRKTDKKAEMPNRKSVSFNVQEKPDFNNKTKTTLKNKNLIKAGSYTGVSVHSTNKCIPDQYIIQENNAVSEDSITSIEKVNSYLFVTETPVTPTKSHLRSPRVLTNTISQMATMKPLQTTPSINTVLKTGKKSSVNPLHMQLKTDAERSQTPAKSNLKHELKNIEELCIEMEKNYTEQTKPKSSIAAALKTLAGTSKLSEKENVLPKMERPETPPKTNLDHSHASEENLEIPETKIPLNAETPTKACIKYNQKAQQALSALNNGVSSALRESFCSIDEIKFRVRNTIEEIDASDKLYRRLKAQHNLASQSTPDLSEPDENVNKPDCDNLLHALGLGLVQTQSENQFRLALLDDTTENMSERNECMHEFDESPLKIPPLAEPAVKEPKSILFPVNLPEPPLPVLPKIVPIVEAINQPCTTLKQQKIDIFNIPPHLSLQDGDSPGVGQSRKLRSTTSKDSIHYPIRKPPTNSIKRPSTPFSKVCSKKFIKRDLAPEIKFQLQEIVARLGLDNLPRSRAQPDLYNKLIKEFAATDSLIEFQRQMKYVKKPKAASPLTDEREANAAKTSNETKIAKNGKVVQIIAEELYVPDRKINKIAPTNLNSTLKNRTAPRLRAKCCQFLYREKKKKSKSHLGKVKKDLAQDSSNTIQLSTKLSSKSKHSDNEKYANSLWFCSHSKKEIKQSNKNLKQPVPITESDTVIKCESKKSIATIENAAQTQTDDNSSNKAYWPQLHLQSTNCKSGLDCFDILDEITLKDIKPLESEYPRRDHIGLEPFYTPTENTYLYKLVYGSTEEQFLQLLSTQEPSVNCATSNCQLCQVAQKVSESSQKRKASEEFLEKSKKSDFYIGKENVKPENKRKPKKIIEKCYPLYNIRTVAGSSHPSVVTCKGWEGTCSALLNGKRAGKNQKRKSSSLNSRRSVDKTNKQQEQTVASDKISQIKPTGTRTKKSSPDVVSKLLPYMYDPKMRYPTTITVMPVTVTTYTNPNFAQHNKAVAKGQGGDVASSTHNKLEHKTEPKSPVRAAKMSPKPSSVPDKKLWDTKYPKSPSINLITYLEKQNTDYPKQTCGDTVIDDFYPNPKNASTPAGSRTGKKNVPMQPPLIRVHTQPHVVKAKPSTKTTSARAPHPKQETHKKSAQKLTFENDIQNVIEMIEGKIIDLVSSPEKLHSEAFNSVEKEIVDILKAMKTEQVKPLEVINETIEKKGKSDLHQKKRANKIQLRSRTSTDLGKPLRSNKEFGAQTDSQLIDELIELSTSGTTDFEQKSPNEESFEITSSCAPLQTPKTKLNQVNLTQIDTEAPVKIDEEGQTIESCCISQYQPKIIKNISQLSSSKAELQISQNELKISISMHDMSGSNSLVAKLDQLHNSIPIIIKKPSGLLNFGNSLENNLSVKSNNFKNELQKIPKNLTVNKTASENEKLQETDFPKILQKSQDIPEHDSARNLHNRKEEDSEDTKSDNQIQIIKSISKVEGSDSEKNSFFDGEDNLQQINSVSTETKAVVAVTSEQVLTPFMYALKHYRQEEHTASSYNILEFLDTLTNISEDTSNLSAKTITGCQLSKIHYKHKIEVAYPVHEPEIFYPVVIWEPVTISSQTNKEPRIFFRPEIITHELQRARSLLLSLNLSKLLGFGSPSPLKYEINLKNTDVLCYNANKIDLRRQSSLKAICNSIDKHSKSNEIYNEDHGTFLNTVYTVLFTAVFLSLSFNYTCQ